MIERITMKRKHILFVFAMTVATFVLSCSESSIEFERSEGVNMKYDQNPRLMKPLEIAVDEASDDWWFYDNFSFVTRQSAVGNLFIVAEIGRCLDDGDVTKTFDCRRFDGSEWGTVLTYSEPDVIKEMKTISKNPQMELIWIDPNKSGSVRMQLPDGIYVILDFQNLEPFYSISNEIDFKRTYASGLGWLQIGDTIWEGRMFYEMINVRRNNECEGEMPDFNPTNQYRFFGQTAAGKTVIASIDLADATNNTHQSFFSILDGGICKVAYGAGLLRSSAKDFREVPGYSGVLPHYFEMYSGDSINVRLDLWTDKDEYDVLERGWTRTGAFGNAVFWNRREKVWGLMDYYQKPGVDTLSIVGQ